MQPVNIVISPSLRSVFLPQTSLSANWASNLDDLNSGPYSPNTMTKRERVEAVLRNQRPDHPPVSFWHHFPPDQITGQPAVAAHMAHLEKYDLDFLKAMNDHPFPRGQLTVAQTAGDLAKIEPKAGDVEGFGGQLEVLRQLRRRLGDDVLMCTTIFNAWAILRYLTAPQNDHHGPPKLDSGIDPRDQAISAMLREDRAAVRAALAAIATSQANFARECIAAGADGIFLSVRDDWVNTPHNGMDTYDEMMRELDLQILAAADGGTFNMLHICGRPQNFSAFAAYPAHAINWEDRAAGPSIAQALGMTKLAIAAGVDNLNTLPCGSAEDCAQQVKDALGQAQTRPIMIAAGCTYDAQAVPEANLLAVVSEARRH